MKKMMLLLIVILNIACMEILCAQNGTAVFNYDANGNRVYSDIIVVRADDYVYAEFGAFTQVPDTVNGTNISVYPNPTNNYIIISTETAFDNGATATIMSANGNKLNQSILSSNMVEYDMTPYSPGIYFLKIETNDGTNVWKIIKR